MFHHYGWGWGAGWWIFGGLLNVLFWVAIVFLVLRLIRGGRFHHHHDWHHDWHQGSSNPALRVLEERYAKGEISQAEFVERRSVLMGQSPPAPPPPPS